MYERTVVLLEYFIQKRIEKYSLGLNYLHSTLLANDFNSFLMICEQETIDKVLNKIIEKQPQVVGIKLFIENTEFIFELCRALKKYNPLLKIVLGGHIATLYAASILNRESSIDFIVSGEGEKTLLELCRRLFNGSDISDCKGIFYRQDKIINKNTNEELIDNLDSLPLPSLDFLKERANNDIPYSIIPMMTGRGCVGRCSYCIMQNIYRHHEKSRIKWRGRSVDNVLHEIGLIKQKYPQKNLIIHFLDSSIENPDADKKTRLKLLTDCINDSPLNISFSFITRAESWTPSDSDLVKKLKNAGLFKVSLGFNESINFTSSYDFTKKSINPNLLAAYQLFKENRILINSYLILFQPYLYLEELYTCVDFLEKINMLHSIDVWIHRLSLFPDTQFFTDVVNDGLLCGLAPDGYSYQYGYIDGRVALVNKAIDALTILPGVFGFRESMSKIEYEKEIYYALKFRNKEMDLIKEEMNIIDQEAAQIYQQTGWKQKELFIQLVDDAKTGKILTSQNLIINEWNQILLNSQTKIEKAWLLCRMKTARKKVHLV